MKKIIILGASGGCLDVIDIIEQINAKKKIYKIIGLLDDKIKKNIEFPNYELLGKFDDVKKYKDKKDVFFVTGIGSDKNFLKKEKIIKRLNINKKKFITLIHPTSIISKNVVIGNGNIIHNNVSIGSNTKVLPVEVCSNVVIGAGAVVTKDIKEPGVYAGNPIRLIKTLSNHKRH